MNEVPPTLVLLSPGFPENEGDTTCLPAVQVFTRLLHRQYPSLQIVVIAFQYPFTHQRYQWNGIEVIPLNGRNRHKFHRLNVWRKAWMTLEALRKENRIIGLLSFWCTESALLGKWFGRRHSLLHRCWISGQDARAGNGLIRLIRPTPGELIALSDFLADEFYRNYGIRTSHIIPGGIDPAQFGPAIAEKSIDVLGVGSLIQLKQYDIFVQIVRQLKVTRPAIKGVICGKGPEAEHLRELICRYGLEENIQLAGEQSHPEVLGYMQRARVFLHTSSYEGFGNVCLEALYAGARVISFCRPMKEPIDRWYIVNDMEEMIRVAGDLLTRPVPAAPLLPVYPAIDSVRKVMQLFGFDGSAG